MAIEKRKCIVCDKEHYGSKNKKTCSDVCRQKLHRQNKKRKEQENG